MFTGLPGGSPGDPEAGSWWTVLFFAVLAALFAYGLYWLCTSAVETIEAKPPKPMTI
ncbi:MAG: hypothetical protein KDA44_08140 [Planctomycetales bacterium]|nr:hypothetical protein [Planctomycetales bacterium]